MEPKSGKLHKLAFGLFGPKWTEKWVHLDGKVLKYFPMATEQPVFSLSSSRQSSAIALGDYEFALGDDKKLNRKFTFQFVAKEKTRAPMPKTQLNVPPVIAEKLRRAEEAFTMVEYRRMLLLHNDASELQLVQQQLDPSHTGRITRDRFLTWLKNYYNAQEVLVGRIQVEHQNQQSSQRSLEDGAEKSHRSTDNSRSTAIQNPTTQQKQSGANTKALTQHPKVEVNESAISRGSSKENCAVDWNEEFEAVLGSRSTDTSGSGEPSEYELSQQIAHGIAAASFFRRFREAAELTVQIVIEELALGNEAKSIRELPLEEPDDEIFGSPCSGADDGLNTPSLLSAGMKKFWAHGLLVYVARFESAVQPTSRKSGSTLTNTSTSLHLVIAHKHIGHQVRAARALHDVIHRNSSNCGSLRVPLQCTIDYLGFRGIIFASTSESLMKSKNGHHFQYHNASVSFQSQLTNEFNALGLMTDSLEAPSSTQKENGALIPAFSPRSARFEAKSCEANQTRHFIHNIYDLFPADVSASIATTISEAKMRATEIALFKFRPEFVRMYGDMLPLHSNAHLGLLSQASDEDGGDLDSNEAVHHRHQQLKMQILQQAACSASEYFHCEVIPSFVRSLEESSSSAHVVDSRSLTFAMHREGINIRYLGLCYSFATLKHMRRLLLSEMVARVCKIELRAALRAIVQETTAKVMKQASASSLSKCDSEQQDTAIPDEDETTTDDKREMILVDSPINIETTRAWSRAIVHTEARQVVVEFFNLVFGISSAESKLFWKERILPHVRLKFGLDSGNSSNPSVLSLEAILNDELLHLPQLFLVLQTHSHFVFEDRRSFNFKATEPFKVEDLQPHCLYPLTNLLARTTVQCEDALESVDELLENGQLEDALTQVKFHIAIFDSAPDDERALPLAHLLTCAAELSYQLDRLDDAERFAALAIENGPKNHALNAKAHTISMKTSHAVGDVESVRKRYAQAVEAAQCHLGASHPFLFDTHMSMAEIMGDCGDYNEALRVIGSCVEIARECFGRTSLVFADLRRRQGAFLYESKGHLDEAVGVLEDAIGVYEKHFHGSDSLSEDENSSVGPSCKAFAASCCYLIAAIHSELSDARSDVEKAYSMARRALTLRKEVLSTDHVDILASHLQLGALANELGDSFRSLEYFKRALVLLKQLKNDDEEESIEQIRVVTQTMLQLQLSFLAQEKVNVVERTKKRFATLLTRSIALYSDQSSKSLEDSEVGDSSPSGESDREGANKRIEADTVAFVMKKLFTDDPIEYLDWLIERTDQELQGYRKQYTMDLTSGTLRQGSAEAPSPHFKRLQSPTTMAGFGSRFASLGSYLSPPASPSPSPASPLRPALPLSPLSSSRSASDTSSWIPGSPIAANDTLSLMRDHRRLSFSQMECNFLTTPSGEFTFGGQLAALLFLAER